MTCIILYIANLYRDIKFPDWIGEIELTLQKLVSSETGGVGLAWSHSAGLGLVAWLQLENTGTNTDWDHQSTISGGFHQIIN